MRVSQSHGKPACPIASHLPLYHLVIADKLETSSLARSINHTSHTSSLRPERGKRKKERLKEKHHKAHHCRPTSPVNPSSLSLLINIIRDASPAHTPLPHRRCIHCTTITLLFTQYISPVRETKPPTPPPSFHPRSIPGSHYQVRRLSSRQHPSSRPILSSTIHSERTPFSTTRSQTQR